MIGWFTISVRPRLPVAIEVTDGAVNFGCFGLGEKIGAVKDTTAAPTSPPTMEPMIPPPTTPLTKLDATAPRTTGTT
ncbi:MAG: hypothetical protein KDJ15_06980 [Alphaproteobacteria bacterium]|nr:hypothetical protein [Alphaproteobacteria bacterium]